MPWAIALALLLLIGAAVVVALGFRTPNFVVDEQAVRISNSLYGRAIDVADLHLDQARLVDLATSPELSPKWRTNGIGLPGRQSGWFRLRNGEKALLFLTRRNRILYIPSKSDYVLMLSPDNAESFLPQAGVVK